MENKKWSPFKKIYVWIRRVIKSIGANKREYWFDENGVKHTRLIIKRMK